MHRVLRDLPDLLLQHLGRCSRIDALVGALESRSPPVLGIRQAHSDKPYHVSMTGCDLTMQCVNPHAKASARMWGLHGFTLHTIHSQPLSPWRWKWPDGVAAGEATAQNVLRAFSVPSEEAVVMHPTLCFTVPGIGEQTWTVMCLFDERTKKLRTFSLVRAGDWVVASVLSEWPESLAKVASTPQASLPPPPSGPPPITCRSSATVPKTGWFEARLPADHAGFRYFSQSSGRFVRKHKGERMLTLGVVPFKDEDLVVWTWQRD